MLGWNIVQFYLNGTLSNFTWMEHCPILPGWNFTQPGRLTSKTPYLPLVDFWIAKSGVGAKRGHMLLSRFRIWRTDSEITGKSTARIWFWVCGQCYETGYLWLSPFRQRISAITNCLERSFINGTEFPRQLRLPEKGNWLPGKRKSQEILA